MDEIALQETKNAERGYPRFSMSKADYGYSMEFTIYGYDFSACYGEIRYYKPKKELTAFLLNSGMKYIPVLIRQIKDDFGVDFSTLPVDRITWSGRYDSNGCRIREEG
jgi:hypothetical protein